MNKTIGPAKDALLLLGFHHLANLQGQSYGKKELGKTLYADPLIPAIDFWMASFNPKRAPMLNMITLDQQGDFATPTHHSSSSANDKDAVWKIIFS